MMFYIFFRSFAHLHKPKILGFIIAQPILDFKRPVVQKEVLPFPSRGFIMEKQKAECRAEIYTGLEPIRKGDAQNDQRDKI